MKHLHSSADKNIMTSKGLEKCPVSGAKHVQFYLRQECEFENDQKFW